MQNDFALPGTRVRVISADKQEELGLGTHLGDFLVKARGRAALTTPNILLDKNLTVILGAECSWIEALNAPRLSAFVFAPTGALRIFHAVDSTVIQCTNLCINEQNKVRVEKLEARMYDHRIQVVARFMYEERTSFTLVSEMGFQLHSGGPMTLMAVR